MSLNIIEDRLRRENNLPEDFSFCYWESFPKNGDRIYIALSGSVCPPFKSGPRKGRPNRDKGTGYRTFNVTVETQRQWVSDWERETGKCAQCRGEGKTVAKCGVNIPTEYLECGKCKGSGKA